EKIFLRARSALHGPQKKLPSHHKLPPKKQVVEHHVGHLDHSLGHIVRKARVPAPGHQLHKLIEHDHHGRHAASHELHKTLSQLSIARTLTDSHASEVRGHLARIDSILSRVKGKLGEELAHGANEIGQILSHIGSLA